MNRTPGPLSRILFIALLAASLCLTKIPAQTPPKTTGTKPAPAPDSGEAKVPESEMRAIIEYYVADRGSLSRSYPVATSTARRERFQKFYADALERILQGPGEGNNPLAYGLT